MSLAELVPCRRIGSGDDVLVSWTLASNCCIDSESDCRDCCGDRSFFPVCIYATHKLSIYDVFETDYVITTDYCSFGLHDYGQRENAYVHKKRS